VCLYLDLLVREARKKRAIEIALASYISDTDRSLFLVKYRGKRGERPTVTTEHLEALKIDFG